MANFGDYYLNGSSLSTATAVFSDSSLTSLAAAGYYSDGIVTRFQTASVGLGPVLTCPTCVDAAPSTIQALNNEAGRYSIYTNFGSAVGAIKVTASGLVSPTFASVPVGLFFLNTNTQERYYRFSRVQSSSPSPAGPIIAPNTSLPQFYYWSSSSLCTNWSSSSMLLNRFEYNTQANAYQATGETPYVTTNANQIPAAIPEQDLGPGTLNDELVTYIPKTSTDDFTLLSQLYLPCPTSATGMSSPLITISAPAVLSAVQCTSGTPVSHAAACGQSLVFAVDYYWGKMDASASVISYGDLMFQDENAAQILFDGYYKADGADLNGVSTATGTFRTQNGVVTEIQNC